MIYSLSGKVSKLDENTIAVDTGAVSFEVTCSTYTVLSFEGSNEKQTILTYLQVREDAMCLFGFKDKKEKLMFNDLIQVSGVGPKMAISILSGLPLDSLVSAIISSDIKTLSTIKGLGKKTAERIVLELKNKFGDTDVIQSLLSNDIAPTTISLKKEVEEAIEVLVSTGLQRNQAIELAKSNYVDGMTGEQLVVACFRNLK